NFALHGLARRHGAAALNLVIDNDTVKSTAVAVPAPPSADNSVAHLGSVSFDRGAAGTSYEEYAVHDPPWFQSFPQGIGERRRPWESDPLLKASWPEVLRRAGTSVRPNVGECFASARRGLERAWGCHNLEVPLSSLCRTRTFAIFAGHLLGELPRF